MKSKRCKHDWEDEPRAGGYHNGIYCTMTGAHLTFRCREELIEREEVQKARLPL